MKNNYLFTFLFLLISTCFTQISAQESAEILKLKNKIGISKSDREKMTAYAMVADGYGKIGKLDSTGIYLEKVVDVAKKINNVEQEGRATIFLGQMALQKGETDKGIISLKKAEILLKDSKNYESKALLNQVLAFSLLLKKNNTEAANYFNKNIALYDQGKMINTTLVSAAYQGLISNQMVQDKAGGAYTATNNYLNFVKKNNPKNLKDAYFFIGLTSVNTKDSKRAIPALKKSIELTDKKDLKSIANSYNFLGMAYKELKKADSAKYYLNKSIRYFEANPSVNNELSLAYYALASVYEEEKNFAEAENFINKAIKLVPEKDIQSLNYNYNFMLHKIQLAKIVRDNTVVRSEVTKQNVQSILDNLNNDLIFLNTTQSLVSNEMKIELYKELSSANEYLGNYEDAFKYHKIYTDENEKKYGVESMKELSDLQSKEELKNQKIKLQLEEETRRIQLQKEIELKALRFEYEAKQNLAKTKEEKERLLLEEDLKRKEIEIKYTQEQKEVELKYGQQIKLNKVEQEKKNALANAELESSKKEKNMYALGVALSLLLLGFAAFSYYQKQKDNKKIAEEKKKSDELLLNILPFEVAEELKEKGKTSAKHYDEVSVLFTDFVNFTVNSEQIGVQEVIEELNVCFTEFDHIMGKYNLEKIKTIGDAYLAVSGLPVADNHHAQNAIKAALEILEFTKKRKLENPNALDIRIGIHSGPVIAGIVGVKKFAYDIWGDTVNTAARMEQNSTSGEINVSETTFNLAQNDFSFQHRGEIETKGKGAMKMYFVNKI